MPRRLALTGWSMPSAPPSPTARSPCAPIATTTSTGSCEQCQDPVSSAVDDGARSRTRSTTPRRSSREVDAGRLGRRARGASRSRPTGGTPAPSSCATRARAGPRSPSARTRGSRGTGAMERAVPAAARLGLRRARAPGRSSGTPTWATGPRAGSPGGSASRFEGTSCAAASPSAASSSTPGSAPCSPPTTGSQGRPGWRCRCSRPTGSGSGRWRESDVPGSSRRAPTRAPSAWLGRMPDPYGESEALAWLEHQPENARHRAQRHLGGGRPRRRPGAGGGQLLRLRARGRARDRLLGPPGRSRARRDDPRHGAGASTTRSRTSAYDG